MISFMNPVFHQGVNTCFCQSLINADLLVGDVVMVTNKNGENVGEILILGVMVCEFKNIPQTLLDLNHDPGGRSFNGLEMVMNTIHGAGSWGPVVTTIIFQPLFEIGNKEIFKYRWYHFNDGVWRFLDNDGDNGVYFEKCRKLEKAYVSEEGLKNGKISDKRARQVLESWGKNPDERLN
jgi:hypothetical protein